MSQPVIRRIVPLAVLMAGSLASHLQAAILYSNLEGNYVAQQTSSFTLNKGTSSATGPDTIDFGATAFGDDYAVNPTLPTTVVNGVPSVQVSGLKFYGNATPSAGNPTGSLGVAVLVEFYNAAGVRYPQSINLTTELQGTNGLHTATFSPAYIPATGFVVFSPYLYATNGGFGTTPRSYGDLTLTGYFGGTPTVGTTSPLSYTSRDTNGNLATTLAQPGSPANLQFALIGVPEPTSLSLVGLALYGGSLRRRRCRAR